MVWLLLWFVVPLLLELLFAPFEAVWFAALVPPVTLPPAMFTGTFALTAFWFAFAAEAADWPV
jgi:uncharacterized membrane protein YjjB (DUF3815 family)